MPFSGTVGAAAYAAHDAGIPGIAFSGKTDDRQAFNTAPISDAHSIYASLATSFTQKIIESGTPYLPEDVFLNVNFPEISDECNDPSKFKWVLSRINPGIISEPDVKWCGSTRLPMEDKVVRTRGCYISVSVGDASDKTTADDDRQAEVLAKLQDLLVCLP